MTVVEPMNCGLGGDFFAMIHKRKSGKETKDTIYGWNGSGFTSAKLTMEGMVQQLHAAGYNGSDSKYLAAGNSPIPVQGIFAANTIPATAASWCHLHAMHGNLPWETLFSQAIHYALNGFPVSIHSRKNWDHLHRFVDTFSLTSSIFTAKQFYDFMRVFGIGSIGPLPGERYRNPILGKTLIDLQKRGCNEFYGPMGQAMADYYIRARSTILQAEDFRKAQQSVQEMISLLQRKIKKDQDFSWVNLSPTSLSLSSTATSLSHPMPPLTCTFMVDGETYSIQTVGENSQAFTACYILKILEVAIASTSLFRQEKAYRLFVHVIAKRLVSGVILTRLGGDNVVDHGSKNRWDMKDWLGITTKELCQLIEDSYRRRQPFPMDRFHLVAPTGNTDINLSRNVSQNSLTGIRYPQSNTLSEDRQPGGAGKRVRSFRKSQAMRRGYKGLMKAQDTMPGDTVAMAVTDAQGLSVAALQSLGGAFGSGITVPILGFALQNRGSAFAIHQGHVAYSSSQQSSSSSSTAYRNGFAAQKRPLHTLSPWILCNHNGSRLLAIKGGDRQPYVFTQLLVNSLVLGLSVENAVDAPRFRHVLPQDPSPSNPLRHLQFLERRRRKVNANVWDWAWLRNTTVEFEPGYDLTTHDVSILSDLGINVLIRYPTDSFEDSGFGLIQLISKVEGGTVQAIADTLRKPGSTFAG